jgi:hypothetical protein
LPLTENLVLSGRDDEAARVWRWLHADPAILAVEAEAPSEAISFLAAAFGQLPPSYRDFYNGKSVVVANPDVARSLADVPTAFTILATSARSMSSFWFFVICSHFFAIIASSNEQEFVLSVADEDPVCGRKRMREAKAAVADVINPAS